MYDFRYGCKRLSVQLKDCVECVAFYVQVLFVSSSVLTRSSNCYIARWSGNNY